MVPQLHKDRVVRPRQPHHRRELEPVSRLVGELEDPRQRLPLHPVLQRLQRLELDLQHEQGVLQHLELRPFRLQVAHLRLEPPQFQFLSQRQRVKERFPHHRRMPQLEKGPHEPV